jgi:yersiniabactin salicyl-AMP ligase
VVNKSYEIDQVTFGDKLLDLVKLYGNKTAIIDGQETYTYKEFLQNVDALAAGYLSIGLKKGDYVLLQLPNTAGFIFTTFALAKIGVVPIMGLPALREGDLKHLIKFTQPKAYISADDYLGYNYVKLGDKLKNEFDCIDHLIYDSEDSDRLTIQKLCKKELETLDQVDQADQVLEQGVRPKDLVFLLLSGGTTSVPKLIPRTHGDYLYNAKKASCRCQMDEETVFLASLPIAHNFALGNAGVLGTFLSGGCVVLSRTSSPDEILELISHKKVTHTGMVPALVSLCMDMLEWWDDLDLSSWKVLQVGGSVLEASVAQRIVRSLPCQLQQVFGTAEGLTCMTRLSDTEDIVLSCQGTPISELDEIKIIDENGQTLPPGAYGELITCGPYTIHAYLGSEEVNKGSFTEDGYYRTGDRATITEAGNLVVTGRISEQINRGGEKIMPIELEHNLGRHPLIKEASVIGIPDKMYGQQTCAFIISENQSLSIVDLNAFLRDQGLSDYKRIDSLFTVEAFPLTNVGKIDKKQLKEMAIAEQTAD